MLQKALFIDGVNILGIYRTQ